MIVALFQAPRRSAIEPTSSTGGSRVTSSRLRPVREATRIPLGLVARRVSRPSASTNLAEGSGSTRQSRLSDAVQPPQQLLVQAVAPDTGQSPGTGAVCGRTGVGDQASEGWVVL